MKKQLHKCINKHSSSLYNICSPFQSNNSTSNTSVALGGIFGEEPDLPYAYSDLHSSMASSPRFIDATPMSHAFITLPTNNNAKHV